MDPRCVRLPSQWGFGDDRHQVASAEVLQGKRSRAVRTEHHEYVGQFMRGKAKSQTRNKDVFLSETRERQIESSRLKPYFIVKYVTEKQSSKGWSIFLCRISLIKSRTFHLYRRVRQDGPQTSSNQPSRGRNWNRGYNCGGYTGEQGYR
ncbi:hypothetical protein RvY_04705 [Ramazzottius varieornatus]|uniref:Uncharacterized protein n=1 Tax=Ramazzottius varieornatus TaxID=947166 RepID=A0A1D1USK7_RAMVA|nr:hypothetical protein RvY_04705 [Ramazzottius varieornatus]